MQKSDSSIRKSRSDQPRPQQEQKANMSLSGMVTRGVSCTWISVLPNSVTLQCEVQKLESITIIRGGWREWIPPQTVKRFHCY
jgi:hypothetical protein